MSRRIEIELTSKRSDSEWTWRAAGAKQPKGILDSGILYEGAKAGDVVKADADFEIEGITILSVSPPQGRRIEKDNRIEIKGPERKFEPVTSTLAPKSARSDRKDRPKRDGVKPPRSGRDDASRRTRDDAKSPADREKRRPPRPESSRRERPQAPAFKKLVPKDDHRRKVLEKVPAEQRPIAEKVLRGGIPSVRQAIDEENARAKAEGRPEINSVGLLALAEELLPQLKSAEWMDRAEAAKASVTEISVRDLRAVVSSGDTSARGEEARLLAAELREALDRRSAEARDTWLTEMNTALDENRILRALNLSSRPPDPQSKFPPELLERLKGGAEAALTPETRSDHWMKLLDSLSKSPVRRSVEKIALPTAPGEALLEAAKEAVGKVPALAKLLGVSMPPPPRRRVPPPPAPKSTEAAAPAAEVTTPATASSPVEAEAPTTEAVPASEPQVHDDQAG